VKKLLTILIGFVHDFAAGGWAATVFAVWWLERQVVAAEAVALVVGLQKNFFYLGLFCVFLVMATGAGRSFTYVGNVYGEDAEKVRRRMLLVKHVVLFVLFGLGTWWQYSLVFS